MRASTAARCIDGTGRAVFGAGESLGVVTNSMNATDLVPKHSDHEACPKIRTYTFVEIIFTRPTIKFTSILYQIDDYRDDIKRGKKQKHKKKEHHRRKIIKPKFMALLG